MRRSKSNPAKYARNYRSISQRRMTTFDGMDEEQEMKRLRNVLKEGERKLAKEGDDDGPSKRKRPSDDAADPYEGILSKELLQDQGGGGYNDSENPLLIVGRKKKRKAVKKSVELTPQEIKQAKQLQKKASRKLKQLETRAAQKAKRKTLYSKLQETALTQEKMKLLSSSSTLGKQFSKKEQLKKILQKERAGIKLTDEEHDLLYRDRARPDNDELPRSTATATLDQSQSVSLPQNDKEISLDSTTKDNRDENDPKKKKKSKASDEACSAMSTKERETSQSQNDADADANAKDGDPQEIRVESKSSASSLAAQMMASLTTLKSTSVIQAEKAAKDRAQAERKRELEEEAKHKPAKRYIPQSNVVLKSAATLGISSTKQSGKSHIKIREVERPADVSASRYNLPVATMEFEVMDTIRNNDVTIICAETGSGKSTQIPQFLYEAGMSKSVDESSGGTPCRIAVTQPRRVAAVSTAKRVCYEMGQGNGISIESPRKGEGNLVAYQTRYESAGLGDKNHILFMTDGILLQEIQSDLLLRKYNVIVLDEAHERGLNTDVLIGLLSAAIPLRKQASMEEGSTIAPLRLVIMSATLRVADFDNDSLFPSIKPAVVKVPGRTHPVTIHHSKVTELDNYEDAAFKKVCKIHRKLPQGGILLFLTGKQEIVRMVKRLRRALSSETSTAGILDESFADISQKDMDADETIPRDLDDEEIDGDIFQSDEFDDFDDLGDEEDVVSSPNTVKDDSLPHHVTVLPLYSLLSVDDQAKVFAPVQEGHRLIVVATNIAETSITIPGISYVVDSGRQKCRNYNSTTGMASFDIMWISKAAADQRAGRSGRMGPGHCYRLYSSSLYSRHMDAYALPEVLTRPLEDVVLAMKAMKISNVAKFPFPTPPDKSQVDSALNLLANIGCIDVSKIEVSGGDGEVTRLGIAVSKLPLGVRFGKMLLVAAQAGVLDYAIAMVAGLSEANPFVHQGQLEVEAGQSDSDDKDHDKDEPVKKTKNHRWRHKAGDAMAVMLAVGAYAFAGRGAGGSSERVACRKFCEENGLNFVIMERIHKMRVHLARLAHIRLSNAKGVAAKTGGILSSMPPPSRVQERLLCQAVGSGLLDNVAMLAPLGSIPGQHPFSLRSAYLPGSTTSKDPLFVDRNSVIYCRDSRQLPKWVCYETLLKKTLKDGTIVAVMKTLTPIEPSWLGVLAEGSNLLSIGEPVTTPAPSYDTKRDAVVCGALTKFGKQGWEVPSVRVEMFDALQSCKANSSHFMPDDSFRWFARFLLEGKVFAELCDLEPMLNDSPTVITRRSPMSKVGILVSKLAAEGIDSARALRTHWAEVNNTFLFPQLRSWIKQEHQSSAKKLWIALVKKETEGIARKRA